MGSLSIRWSPSQQPRALAYANARFEQTALEHQPMPQSAMEMIAQVPAMRVQGRKAVCDGGTSSFLSLLLLFCPSAIFQADNRTRR